jgi:predicted ribosomally synthesized peptide with nif11-like leader
MERMQTDNDFAKKIIACKDWETALPIISGEGFQFTLEEFKSLTDDICDDDLASVSGGLSVAWSYQ